MPSTSPRQAKTMTAACKSPKFRSKIGIPKDVACKFHGADKGKYHEEINMNMNINEYSDMISYEQAKQLLDVAIKKNQPVPEKVIAALNYYRKNDRNGVNEMSDKQLDEKLRFGKAKEDISAEGSPDIGRLMKMAGIQKKLDDDREEGKLDIRGILTGVAKGSIDVTEADARLQELAGMTTKISETSPKEQDNISFIQEIEQQIKQTHLVEDNNEEVDEAKDEEVDEAKDEEVDEAKEEVDEDKEEVNESHWWTEGRNESERILQLAGLKAKAFTEAVDKDEVDETKDEEVDEDKKEDLDEDSESYLAARDKAIKKAMGKDTDDDDDDDDEDDDKNEDKEAIDEEIERKYFRKLDVFKEGSLSRFMAEIIVDEMNKGKNIEQISEELAFDADEVSYIVEFVKNKVIEAKQVNSQWGNERASDKEDRIIARLDKKDTGDAQNAKPKPRKRDRYDDMAAVRGLDR